MPPAAHAGHLALEVKSLGMVVEVQGRGNLAPAETAACNPLTRHPGARRDLLGGAGEIVGRAIAAHGSHPGRVHLGCGRLGPKMPNAYGCDSVPLSIEGIAAGREPHPRSLFVTSV
ncbi:MAG TPA: hypothetical protein VFA64_10535 [Hyphomicrobiaceae bacterium]|nr:hypothetical protein [Hyphomicrobiaceae bacterium]